MLDLTYMENSAAVVDHERQRWIRLFGTGEDAAFTYNELQQILS
ncbi:MULTISPECIES: hypothetical protein [Peribacillus]|nr:MULTISPECIES: hypothetical protein [Peribacillus]MDQ0882867.1 ribonuclease PH [Peribacillus sp. V2I11]